nr:hypothetical protein P5630_11475 [Bacillus subtilis]
MKFAFRVLMLLIMAARCRFHRNNSGVLFRQSEFEIKLCVSYRGYQWVLGSWMVNTGREGGRGVMDKLRDWIRLKLISERSGNDE